MPAILTKLLFVPPSGSGTESAASLTDRSWTLGVFAVFALAFCLRALALWSLSSTVYFTNLMPDEWVYHTWATKIANGTYRSTSVYQFAPLPAYIIAGVYTLLSPDVLYTRILNILLGSATCVVICLLGKLLGNRITGLIAGGVATAYKPFVFYSIVPMKTALSVFLFALSMYLFLTVLSNPSVPRTLSLGLVTGLLASVRQNSLVMIPLILLILLWNGRRDGLPMKRLGIAVMITTLGLCLSMGPFALRNYVIAGEFALTTHQAGFILYMSHSGKSIPFASTIPTEQQTQFEIEASRRAGRKLSGGESSAYWMREVAQAATQDPGAFVSRLGGKTLRLFNQFEGSAQYSIEFVSQSASFLKLPFLGLSVILPLGIAGMAINAARSRPALCVTVLFIAYAATLIVFFTSDRLRLPLLVLLIPFAVIGVNDVISWVRARSFMMTGIYTTLVLVFVVVEFLPVGSRDKSAHYNYYAQFSMRQGLEDEAIRNWELSANLNQRYSDFARLALASRYLSKNQAQKAMSYLEAIPDTSLAAAPKYETLGLVLSSQGRTRQAIAAYKQSLAINPGRKGPRQKLELLLRVTASQGELEK